jgi:nuclear pore complex protein Nup133
MVPESGNVSAIALGAETALGRDIWVLVDTRLQKWNMSTEGWESVVLDEELADILHPTIKASFPSNGDALDLELLDLAVERYVIDFL